MVGSYAGIVGVVILVGVLGLILGEQPLLGLVNIDILEDVVHLVTGGLLAYVGFGQSHDPGGDGRHACPAGEREDWRLGCRVYATPEGLKGSPTAAMFEEVLRTKAAAGAGVHR
jgi:hypothetical protein